MIDKELLVQTFFKNTNTKITEDDPVIEVIMGFQQVLQTNKEDFVEWANIFTSKFEDDLNYLTMENNTKLEILEHGLKDIVKNVLVEFDNKTKDLNMVLAKIQTDYDRVNNDRLADHLAKIDARYHQMLAIQKKNNAFSQRELLFALAGFVVCLMVCVVTLLTIS